ncbi:MAG TPA: helix-turn-helix transcriptional regulator [Terriglobales bacterium]|nr:helix-turn-helix transcriptional regulator [Terriglobales bacterium]
MTLPGQQLRLLREQLGYTLRDVESASIRIASRHKNEEFGIPVSRLSDIEIKGFQPSIFRIYSLAVIYRVDIRQILAWFGVDTSDMPNDVLLTEAPKTHLSQMMEAVPSVQLPVKFDPGFDLRKTTNLGRMIERWGIVPIQHIAPLINVDYTYGYVGTDDYAMYPILLPGSFLQIDESKNEVVERAWRSEYERPIYFIETRTGYFCCWCSLKTDHIILQPHPLSPTPLRIMKHPQEAEVIGQVVGIAMRLDQVAFQNPPDNTLPAKLS